MSHPPCWNGGHEHIHRPSFHHPRPHRSHLDLPDDRGPLGRLAPLKMADGEGLVAAATCLARSSGLGSNRLLIPPAKKDAALYAAARSEGFYQLFEGFPGSADSAKDICTVHAGGRLTPRTPAPRFDARPGDLRLIATRDSLRSGRHSLSRADHVEVERHPEKLRGVGLAAFDPLGLEDAGQGLVLRLVLHPRFEGFPLLLS